MPKLSQFNHFYPREDGNYLAFNAVSGALGIMTAENYNTYKLLREKLSNGEPPNLNKEEQELLSQLQYGQFVIDNSLPEMDWLKFRYRKMRYDPSLLGMIIAPTMACNMACPYCFEENKKGRMSPRIVESILEFVEKRGEELKEVQISWYGGEPLLALDIIEDISESMNDLAKEYKFNYVCDGIITNGYLLDNKMTDHLADMKVGQVQITIDGPSRIHNQKRPLKNGRESYDTIIKNIQYACTKIPTVIRVNIDKSFTREVIVEMLDEFEAAGLRNRVAVYFGQLEPATIACANISESCFETRAYSQTEISYYKLLLERGFFIQKLPQPIITFCFAQLTNSFLVDSNGDMYRCFNYAGDKSRAMGNIQEELSYQHPEFNRLFSFDPFENESCRSCNILPICMGSCPSRRLDRDVPESEVCDSWKFNLQPMLDLVALSRQQQVQQEPVKIVEE
ncbi:MAG: radical SAM protein [bacterium]